MSLTPRLPGWAGGGLQLGNYRPAEENLNFCLHGLQRFSCSGSYFLSAFNILPLFYLVHPNAPCTPTSLAFGTLCSQNVEALSPTWLHNKPLCLHLRFNVTFSEKCFQCPNKHGGFFQSLCKMTLSLSLSQKQSLAAHFRLLFLPNSREGPLRVILPLRGGPGHSCAPAFPSVLLSSPLICTWRTPAFSLLNIVSKSRMKLKTNRQSCVSVCVCERERDCVRRCVHETVCVWKCVRAFVRDTIIYGHPQ